MMTTDVVVATNTAHNTAPMMRRISRSACRRSSVSSKDGHAVHGGQVAAAGLGQGSASL